MKTPCFWIWIIGFTIAVAICIAATTTPTPVEITAPVENHIADATKMIPEFILTPTPDTIWSSAASFPPSLLVGFPEWPTDGWSDTEAIISDPVTFAPHFRQISETSYDVFVTQQRSETVTRVQTRLVKLHMTVTPEGVKVEVQ